MKIKLKRNWMNRKKGRIIDLVEPMAMNLIQRGTATDDLKEKKKKKKEKPVLVNELEQAFSDTGDDKMVKKAPVTK